MSNPLYEKIGSPEDKVIEEAAELIKEIMKARRFGYFSYHPDDERRTTNLNRIKMEMDDVVKKFNEYEKYLMDIASKHYRRIDL